MGDVLLGLASSSIGSRKLVVIKRLHAHLVDAPGMLEMFLDEARLATRLNHPHVVATHEVDQADGTHFIAMEYLVGQPLDQVLRACKDSGSRLPIDLATRIVRDALEGLEHVHQLRDFDGTPLEVVHRDISPHNIFISYDGTVKLIDFGVAKAVGNVVQTVTGVVKGKFPYMSPEQIQDEQLDSRVDLWAMGVVLYEALAGRRPFQSDTPAGLLKSVLLSGVPRLSDVAPGAPEQLAAVVRKSLDRDLDHRYRSAHEMGADLDAWMATEERVARRPEVRAFMTELFSSTMEGHRELIGRAVAGAVDESGKLELVGGRTVDAEGDGDRGRTDDREESRGPRGSMLPTKLEGIRTPPESTPSVAPPGRSSKRRAWLMGAGALGIVLGILMLWVALGGSLSVEGGGSGDVQAPTATGLDPEAEAESTVAENTTASAHTPPERAPEPQGMPVAPAGMQAAAEATAPEIPDDPPAAAVAPFRPSPAKRPRRRPRAPMTAMDPAPAVRGTGYLSLDSMPWANVSLGNQSLGSTPLLRRPLPEGNHVLTLDNPEEGLSMTYRVTVVAGETTTRRVGLR